MSPGTVIGELSGRTRWKDVWSLEIPLGSWARSNDRISQARELFAVFLKGVHHGKKRCGIAKGRDHLQRA